MTTGLIIDFGRCAGHGRCYALAADLFDCDDEGQPVLLQDTVPTELRPAAEDAVANCPERAIELVTGPR